MSGYINKCRHIWLTAANTVGITFVNPTAGGVTPTAGTYIFGILRAESGAGASAVAD